MTPNKKSTKNLFSEERFYFEIILIIIINPIMTLLLIQIFQAQNPYLNKERNEWVEIITDKDTYYSGENLILSVKNNSTESIYFEPCEYLYDFERKAGGQWIAENSIIKNKIYDPTTFDRKDALTRCEISLPQLKEGIYRSFVRIYYGCRKPEVCEKSKTFYSNEFKLIERNGGLSGELEEMDRIFYEEINF